MFHEMDEILSCALREGLLTDPKNFDVLAAICNCPVDIIRGFVMGITHRHQLENYPELNSVQMLQERRGALEDQLMAIDNAIRSKRKAKEMENLIISNHQRKKRQKVDQEYKHISQKLEENSWDHEYEPLEIEPLPELYTAKPLPKTAVVKTQRESRKRNQKMQKTRKTHLVRVRLYCAHCERFFYAKPTKRVNLHVLNHQCNGDKRKQFVVGRHHRRCSYKHPADVPCIDFAPKRDEYSIPCIDFSPRSKIQAV